MKKYVEKVEYIQENKLADFKPNKKEKEAMLKESASKYFSEIKNLFVEFLNFTHQKVRCKQSLRQSKAS